MLNFLFWNTGRKPLTQAVAALAWEHQVDILVLAENSASPAEMLLALNGPETRYYFPFSTCDGIRIYVRFDASYVVARDERRRWTFRSVQLPGRQPFLLAAVHLGSKLHLSDYSQHEVSGDLARWLRYNEKQEGHSRMLLVGDLNMNPFEPGLVGAMSLHAVSSRNRAMQGSRMVDAQGYPYFYNPMWSHFGDRDLSPAGTYHYGSSEAVCYFWNIFDQVLIRPALLDCFRTEELAILTTVTGESLLTDNGFPNKRRYSDHLPLFFRLHV